MWRVLNPNTLFLSFSIHTHTRNIWQAPLCAAAHCTHTHMRTIQCWTPHSDTLSDQKWIFGETKITEAIWRAPTRWRSDYYQLNCNKLRAIVERNPAPYQCSLLYKPIIQQYGPGYLTMAHSFRITLSGLNRHHHQHHNNCRNFWVYLAFLSLCFERSPRLAVVLVIVNLLMGQAALSP